MEYWDVYDINRQKTGRIVERHSDDWLKENEYHIGIHVCVFNSNKEMLIQKRTMNKRADPGKWDFSARGSVLQGETSEQGAKRELLEEVGINYNFDNIRSKFTVNSEYLFDDYYLIKSEAKIDDLKIQEEEVECIKWASKEEIMQMIENGQFAITKKELMDYIFSLYNEI